MPTVTATPQETEVSQKDKERATQKAQERLIFEKLSELGGELVAEDDIAHRGNEFVVPERMTFQEAHAFLGRKIESEEEVMAFHRLYRFRPFDGCHAFEAAIKRVFGMLMQVPTKGFFGGPPNRITINIAHDQTTDIPWGNVEIPALPGAIISLGSSQDEDWGTLFYIGIRAPRKHRFAIEGLFRIVQDELERNSIYRGKAFDGRPTPEFLDLTGIESRQIIYSDDTIESLNAYVWGLLEYTEAQKKNGLPLKRAVLLEGPYGVGKTLCAHLTAQKAINNAWTFLYCRPGRDDIETVMQTARLYQPAVVFFEDMDTVASAENAADQITTLLDVFDGITSKNTEIMVILTTNHAERIHKGMLRPGRLDAVVHMGELDVHGLERLIRSHIKEELLGEIDFQEVWQATMGYMPAFQREVVDRAKRYNIARNHGELTTINTADLVHAANGLRPQLELMEGSKDRQTIEPLGEQFRTIIAREAAVAVRENVHEDYLAPELNGHSR